MINNNNFISIQGWMVNDLQLSGVDLLVYAVIYGFSQDGESVFSGTLQYLQDWTGASKRTVMRSLQALCECGLIKKLNRAGVSNVYTAVCKSGNEELQAEPVTDCHPCQNVTGDKLSGGCGQNVTGTHDKMSPHNNIDNNIIYNNINNTPARKKKQKHKYGEYKNVLLSDEDLDKLKREFPHDWERRIQTLDDYIATHKKGEGYKNHLAVIRTWARNDGQKNASQNKGHLPFTENVQRPEYDDTVFDKLLEMGGAGNA